MLVPSTTTNEVEPPNCGGASRTQAVPRRASVNARLATGRNLDRAARRGGGECAAASRAARVDPLTAPYCAATTVSCVAAAAVACGAVVLQVTLPAAFAQLYQEPAAASCTLSVLAVVGAIVKAT